MKNKYRNGFTLLELMIVMAIATIVVGVGIPNFTSLLRANDTVAEVNNLASALNLARSEAVGRGVEVTIAPLSGTDWSTGWVVGIDTDGDNVFPESGEPILRSFEAVDSLTFTAAPARVEFKPTGEVTNLATFSLLPNACDYSNRRRTLSVAMAGYVDLTRQTC